jgi:hypothetical protein
MMQPLFMSVPLFAGFFSERMDPYGNLVSEKDNFYVIFLFFEIKICYLC